MLLQPHAFRQHLALFFVCKNPTALKQRMQTILSLVDVGGILWSIQNKDMVTQPH